jgi:hypothetical protein
MKKFTALVSFASVLALCACTASFSDEDDDGGAGGGNTQSGDGDGDGHNRPGANDGSGRPQDDCNDNNNTVFPGAPEICNGIDDNCNGQVDENNVCNGNPPPKDSDGDGDPDSTDCFPNDPTKHHGCTEVCGNGLDENCNGTVDEGCNGSSGSCGGCNGSTTGTSTGSGTPNTTCTVTITWSNPYAPLTGNAYVFGETIDQNGFPTGHWAGLNQCVPGSAGSLSGGAMSKNGNSYSSTFTVPNGHWVTFVVSGQYSPSETGCTHSFDKGCWTGGGHGADNGVVSVQVNGSPKGFTEVDNDDNIDDPGGQCYGANYSDPLCCKATSNVIVTSNGQFKVSC